MIDTPPTVPFSFTDASKSSPKRLPIVGDGRALVQLVESLLTHADISQAEMARRLGIKVQSLNQYFRYRRLNPSVQWLVRLVEACGGKVYIEFGPDAVWKFKGDGK